MANEEHVRRLMEGVDAWNDWRKLNPDIVVDLSGANLSGAKLGTFDPILGNLTRTNLTGADFTDANLTNANLAWANLTGANLTRTNLTGANLTGANLISANLTAAILFKAHAQWL
jgi:uncharacterized protein YjbI with pentapeptide repeats